ncbi:alkyl sulfatase dimerization domain-containing protein [Nocardia sp. NBC_01503]|uniref:alkyl sulfatase dimerization domain-containing protein n=1 Tax=Nocardia sp. NBC_01503 TaxID=2975997 RepID=UPI003FA58181
MQGRGRATVSHNVKAIYQRYMGWFDGNPAHLWEHPPIEQAKRYVVDYGGVAAVIAKAKGYLDNDELRFTATLLNHAIFAEPSSFRPER